MLVRLKPYNPRRNHKLRRYARLDRKLYIRGDRGWHEVSEEDGRFLATVCQNGNTMSENDELGLEAIPAFDVADDADHAQEIMNSYKAIKGKRTRDTVGTLDSPVRVSRPGKKRKARKAAAEPVEVPEDDEDDENAATPADLTSDQIAEIRQNKIAALLENNGREELKGIIKKKDIKVSLRKSDEKLAAAIVDHEDEEREFGDD